MHPDILALFKLKCDELLSWFAFYNKVLVSYFTFRALKDTLAQLQETDVSPGKIEYKWLYNFAAANNPNDSHAFLKKLFAERQDYGRIT